ncbi:hypothetical protein N7457_006534 [Penicillium paradoxum]|uniref:uncharacterized protein n=1 Tax=Penicillium paradoxum TaxID=176176 RepID=UPI0025488EB4|nr:uncharacterized protein N7457_006534 [Penicillium paradoxum]KAJ5778814.1 hypothetical protein N7457_006534 [Penicillium paradoxum]
MLLALLAAVPLSLAKEGGYFESSSCADPKGFAKCYEQVDVDYLECVNNNCAGRSPSCYESCGASISCMNQQSPGLGIDCINACEFERSAYQIDCAGQSFWNQVYSSEYQTTVLQLLDVCTDPNRDGLPFWPPSDGASDSCSCNIAQIEMKEHLIINQLHRCRGNMTNLEKLSDTSAMTDYAQACLCCGYSTIISAMWDTCPSTKSSLLGADEWFAGLLKPDHWGECGPYLEAYNRADDFGVGRADASGISNFYGPNSMPINGTKAISNREGIVSQPVSGDTFTWTFGPSSRAVIHSVTVSSADATVAETKTSDGGDSTTATKTSATTGTASEAKPGSGNSLVVPPGQSLS